MDEEEKDRVVLAHLPLVKHIARRVSISLPPKSVDLDDLIQAGTLGLIDAATRFQAAENGTDFKTYAKWRIRGAILDDLRRVDWLTRDDRRLIKKIQLASTRFYARFGRMPDADDLATELSLPVEKVHAWLLRGALRPVALEEHLRGLVDGAELPDQMIYRCQVAEHVQRALERFPTRTVKMMRMYYWEDQTMREIAHQFGLQESRVCQILYHCRRILASGTLSSHR